MALTRPRFSQINTVISEITDPISVLNQGSSLANIDIGLVMNRNNGITGNTAFYWNEAGNTFVAAWTNNTGITNSNITVSTFANVKVGNIFGNIGGGTSQSNVFITGALLPSANLSYDLGSTTRRFKTLWLSGTTIDMDGKTISVSSNGDWSFSTAGNPIVLSATTPFAVSSANITNISSSNISATGGYIDNTIIGANVSSTGKFTTLTVTNSTNTSGLGTGAFIVSTGGASIQKDLYVGGNIYVSNIINQSSSILQVNEPLVYLSAEGIETYNYEIGLFSHFIGGYGYQHTGLVRNHVNNQWYFFSNLAEPTGGTVDLSNTSIIYDTVRAGALILANTTAASSTTSGALQVAGGVGVAGDIYGGGQLVVGGINVLANTGAYQTWANNQITTTQANLGAYQTWANANLATQTTNYNTLAANVGAYETYANANVVAIQANLGAYQIYANANAAAQQTQINNIVSTANTNTAAYISTYTGNVNAGNINVVSNVYTSGIVPTTYYGTINIGTTSFNLARSSGSQTLTGINIDGSSAKSTIVANTSAGTAYLSFVEAISGDHAINATTSLTFNPSTGVLTPYIVSINGGTNSTSTATGALIVSGGAGVSGNVYSGAVYTSGLYWAGNRASITGPAGGANGSITYNNSGSQDGTNIIYDSVTGNVVFTDTTDSASINTGAVVLKGGIGISGNAFIGNVLATGFFYANGTPFSSSNYGNVQMLANLGGTTPVTIGGNLTVTGNLSVIGNISSVSYEYVTNTEFANVLIANTVNAATIGNTGTVFTGASLSLTNVGDVSANIGTLFLGNASTQANIGAYRTYANANVSSLQNQITGANTNIQTTSANLGAYQNWANTSITSLYTSANANTAAYLTTYTGNISTGNITVTGNVNATSNVFANVFYTTSGIKWAGNGAAWSASGGGSVTFTSSTAPPISGNVKGDQWYNTTTDTLYEYINDGTSLYWVDIQSLGTTGNISTVADATLSGNIVVGLSNVYSIGASTGFINNFYSANAYHVTGNIATVYSGNVNVTSNVNSGNVVTGIVTATGNVKAANLTTTGNVTTSYVIATGNVQANYVLGDGSKLTNTTTTGKAIAMSIVFGG
ncbi:hypothetical protein UFOVP257_14 [uncultured Caudovirales phage]|uniref:Uncharacterized protein n=1 Tax=uncultured Caudovirales phage TaxID=2100421 RepID=A0A6J5LFN1_9CAUD|nr:hypothetical protein UFOVP257_14 [uncultured Caudovirales phage]